MRRVFLVVIVLIVVTIFYHLFVSPIIPFTEKFTTPKPGYNLNGDKSMTRVIINAKFGNE